MEIKVGMKHAVESVVTVALTAKQVGSGMVSVYATPMMIALMEQAAAACVQSALDPGSTTVGTALSVAHTGATPVGMQVTAEAEVTAVDGRRIDFALTARDGAGEIGHGTHSRVVVDLARFEAKANAKSPV